MRVSADQLQRLQHRAVGGVVAAELQRTSSGLISPVRQWFVLERLTSIAVAGRV
jgi:hypothetical protein